MYASNASENSFILACDCRRARFNIFIFALGFGFLFPQLIFFFWFSLSALDHIPSSTCGSFADAKLSRSDILFVTQRTLVRRGGFEEFAIKINSIF